MISSAYYVELKRRQNIIVCYVNPIVHRCATSLLTMPIISVVGCTDERDLFQVNVRTLYRKVSFTCSFIIG